MAVSSKTPPITSSGIHLYSGTRTATMMPAASTMAAQMDEPISETRR